MRFLDYVFYRLYVFMQKNEEAPVTTASLTITIFFGTAFPIIWIGIPFLLTGWIPKTKTEYTIIAITVFIIVYLWYKPRIKKIIKKFEHSKYNKKISFFLIVLLLFLISILFLIVEIPIFKWLEDNHYDGIVLKWFLELFE